MATVPYIVETRTNPRRWILKTFLVLLFLLIAAITFGGLWFRHAAVSSLPQLDGSIRLSGLTAPVTIFRDAQGVPHIEAASMQDLVFAQGFVTAQDRLWQMDMGRRFGRGELSEVLGSRTLTIDKRQRVLRLKDVVENVAKNMSPRDRSLFEAYARGVNALIERQLPALPIEFRVLRYSPRPWTVEDSLMIGINISQTLNTQWETEYSREKIVQRLSPVLVADLYPNSSWRDRPPSLQALPPGAEPLKDAKPRAPQATDTFPGFFHWLATGDAEPCDSCYPGSNNWVVSGAHTASGKPLLSNDMHLAHSIPNVWYEVHLKAEAYDVAGFSFPGLPYIIAGHNQRIAWGFTNIGPDVQDLYVEDLSGGTQYRTPHGWEKLVHHLERIKIKGESDLVLDCLVTRHGPLVSRLFTYEPRDLALKWTIYDSSTVSLPFYEMGLAQDWGQFRAALSQFGGPGQNVVYADVDGHIAYQATGKVPIRKQGDGLLPVPGDTDDYEWTGYIPFEQLPSIVDPPSGIIATANGRITPDGYPDTISTQWGSPYRTERIFKVLSSGSQLTAADMLRLQMDTYSEFDRLVANQMVYAVDHSRRASARARQAADIMRAWDGYVTVDAVAPTLAVRARRQLWRLLLEPKLQDIWDDYSWFMSSVALEKLLQTKPQRWARPGEDFDDTLVRAVERAVSQDPIPPSVYRNDSVTNAMANRNPAERNEKPASADLKSMKWGESFTIELNHPIFGAVPVLDRWTGPGSHPLSGDSSLTVKASGRTFGASERATYDLSDLDRSTMNIVTGESGQLFSPHYMDQWNAWYEGSTFTMPFTAPAVRAAARHTLTLIP